MSSAQRCVACAVKPLLHVRLVSQQSSLLSLPFRDCQRLLCSWFALMQFAQLDVNIGSRTIWNMPRKLVCDCGILQGLAAMETSQKSERHTHLG